MFISHLKKRKFLDFTSPKRCHPISLFTSRAISPVILLPLCPHANQPLLSAPAPTHSPLQAAPGKVPGASRLPWPTVTFPSGVYSCSQQLLTEVTALSPPQNAHLSCSLWHHPRLAFLLLLCTSSISLPAILQRSSVLGPLLFLQCTFTPCECLSHFHGFNIPQLPDLSSELPTHASTCLLECHEDSRGHWLTAWPLEPNHLGLDPGPAASKQCDRGQLINLSVAQFSQLLKEGLNNTCTLSQSLWGVNELMDIKPLEQCLAC